MNFAELLDLPHKVTAIVPLVQQIPERYGPVFADGCIKALTEPALHGLVVRSAMNSKTNYTARSFSRSGCIRIGQNG